MENFHDANVGDSAPTLLPDSQHHIVSRQLWHKPVLRRNDITEYTGFAPRGVTDDGGGFS